MLNLIERGTMKDLKKIAMPVAVGVLTLATWHYVVKPRLDILTS